MKNLYLLLIMLWLFAACKPGAQPQQEPLKYPETAKGDVTDDYFGTQVADPYRWLENPDTQTVRDWINAQNEVSFGYLEKIPYRETLRKRLEKVWNYPKYGAPFKKGDHYFFSKNDGLQPQSVLYIQESLESEPHVFLDPNTFSADGTTSLSAFSVSRDGKFAVYGTSEGGSDWNDFYVVDVPSGEKRSDHLKHIKFSGVAWEGNGFYYGRFAAPEEGQELASLNENKKIYYHKLGDDQSKDVLVYEDPAHPKRGIYAQTTEDERFLILYFNEGATNDNGFSIKDLSDPKSKFVPVIENFDNSYSIIDNEGDELFVITNLDAPRKKLMAIDAKNPAPANWKTIIPEQEKVLSEVSLVGGKIVAVYLEDASSHMYTYNLDGTGEQEVELPGVGTVGGVVGKKDSPEAFYVFTSYVYPTTIYRFDTDKNESTVFRKSEIDYDPEKYETVLEFYKSKDGTKIPLFISMKKGLKLDGKNPTMLYGYGGFNVNILPGFRTANTVFMEEGGIYAVAVLRGGGEYGEDWHKDGMLMKKQNVFDDFIAAGEYLIEKKYTSKDYLAIHGRSNGGLLVGAVMCQRPDLFKVALPGVGVMDMLRYHKFTIGHAWVVEYGSSEANEAEFKNLYAYSPLHNLKDGTSYPATMTVTADHDDRVVPAHSFKWAARLQEAQAGNAPVIIRIETQAGHGAGKPTNMVIEEWADIWAFMFYNMGIDVKVDETP
ncbi:MAG: S9 family peptidase [Bacteroidia bacterium]|nr:S9 family peptidase [Bacteroidia bacterium]